MGEPMTDDELSRAVAIACRWKWCIGKQIRLPNAHAVLSSPQDQELSRVEVLEEPFAYPKSGYLPNFATSLDACFGPGGPVEYAKGKGWEPSLNWDAGIWVSEMYYGAFNDGKWTKDDNPARALCLAFLAAIEATSG